MMKANKQIGFININEDSIDKIIKDDEVIFERGFLREKTSTTLPTTFDGVGKDLKDYRVYGNTYQNITSGKNICFQVNIEDANTIRFDINSNKINRTFTLSLIPPLSVNSMSIVAFADGVNLRSVGTINLISGERSTATITLTESIYNTIQNASEVHFNLYKSGAGISTTSIIEEPQIENNSSFTSYEPYTGGQPSPSPEFNQKIVSCGDLITDSQDENYGKYKIPINVRSDNLFDKDNANVLNAYFGISDNKDVITSASTNRMIYIPCKPNTTYTILKSLSNQFSIGYTYVQPAIGVQVYGIVEGTVNGGTISWTGQDDINTIVHLSITTNENAKYLVLRYTNTNNDKNSTWQERLNVIQIVEGSTVPSKYIPYYNETTNIYLGEPLRKIDGYSDYIDFINQKIVRNIDEIVLNGSESWGDSKITRDVLTHRFKTLGTKSHVVDVGVSNKFIVKNSEMDIYDDVEMVQLASATSNTYIGLKIYINRLSTNDVSGLINWLSSNPVTLDYVLETPTEENIELPNIPTIDGNNTLNIETEITPSQVYIKYKSNN